MDRTNVSGMEQENDSGQRLFHCWSFTRFLVNGVFVLVIVCVPSVLAEVQLPGSSSAVVGGASFVDKSANAQGIDVRPKSRYHSSVGDRELEYAVSRAAQQYHLQPALLLAVMKAESSFNPVAVSKAGAVGLMQLIPETALRHGVRNLYDASENIAGGAKHLRYLLDRFHGNVRLALAAYNAGEHKVDRYGKIPPYKETQNYVKKVLAYYRSYKKDGWVIPVAMPVVPAYGIRVS